MLGAGGRDVLREFYGKRSIWNSEKPVQKTIFFTTGDHRIPKGPEV